MKTILVISICLLTGCNLSGIGSPHSKPAKATKAESSKPECDPKTDWAYGDGYTQYKCDKGKWVVDDEALKRLADEEKHKADLYWALRSRVLTSKEMAEVAQYGSKLLVHPMQPYFQEEIDREFNAALLQQFILRTAAAEVEHKEQK